LSRKSSELRFSAWFCCTSSLTAPTSCSDAAPTSLEDWLTEAMDVETCPVPAAAAWTLREIS